jgi:RNA:NAD 2'-phosphotransferase (TPT1/KptA family)
VPGKLAPTPSMPPERFYHGTSPELLEAVLLRVNAAEAATAGVAFYLGNEKVWLADRVPSPFIAEDG